MNKSRFTDLLTQALVFCLAAACLGLAGYKVIQLRSMENPPADLGLNFPAPKRKIISDDTILTDPMPTNTITRGSGMTRAPRILQPYSDEAPIQEYRLLTVIDGVAFVEVLTLRGKQIVPVAAGARLPGAGTVEHIEMRQGHWELLAGGVKLTAVRPSNQ